MCGLSGPKPPPPVQPPPAPPTPADPAVRDARARERRMMAAAAGQASTIRTSSRGILTEANVGRKTLLGA